MPSFTPAPEVTIPWAEEVALQVKFSWTEKQMREDNSMLRLKQIAEFLSAEAKASRARQMQKPAMETHRK
jgi:hypothetical protein